MSNEIANNATLISSFVKGSVVEMHILGISAGVKLFDNIRKTALRFYFTSVRLAC